MQQWSRRRLVLLRRSSRGPLRLVVILSSGKVEEIIDLNYYTVIARVDPALRPHALAIGFRSGRRFRFSLESGLCSMLRSAASF